MEILELFLVLVIAVLVSALLDRRLPRVAAPLVQIATGLVMALVLSISPVIEADPEFFLLLFIAPLLFYESKELDRAALWADKGIMLSLSIALVLVMMVLIGFALHAILPDIPIALCFAVGAALGPTDAAAVVALAASVKFPKRISGVLSAEAIFNDATGVVAFQFALAAAVSGVFDPGAAVGAFLLEFLGGLLCGVVLGALGNWATTIIHDRGMVSVTFHVLFEIAMPFLSFMIGQAIGVSGVLAAVGCGLVFDLRGNGSGADVSKSKIISNGLWKVAAFTLNGIVFVLLGLQLPSGFEAILSPSTDTLSGFAAVAAALGIAIAFRFLWCFVIVKLSRRGWGDNGEDLGTARTTGLLTFGGAKGAITMSAILMMPAYLTGRGILVFVASCVIVATLIFANIVMPKLVPKTHNMSEAEKEREKEARLNVLRNVISKLSSMHNRYELEAINKVIGEYQDRIVEAGGMSTSDRESRTLRLEAIAWEKQRLDEIVGTGKYNSRDIARMRAYLEQKEAYYAERSNIALSLRLMWKRLVSSTLSWAETFAVSLGLPDNHNDEDVRKYSSLRSECAEFAIKMLASQHADDLEIAERVASLIADYRLDMTRTLAYTPQIEDVARHNSQAAMLRLEALLWEEELIEEAFENRKISADTANAMRRTVAMIRFDAEDMI